MKKTKVTHLTKEFEAGKPELVGIRVETEEKKFTIPVADVRRNPTLAAEIQKSANIHAGSKYFRPSYSLWGYSYNNSMKK